MTYSASSLPGGLSINTSTGLIQGTISSGDAGSGLFLDFPTITLHDAHGAYDLRMPTWAIGLTSVSATEGSSVSFDIFSGTPVLSFSSSNLPSGLSIGPANGLISGIPGYANASGGSPSLIVSTISYVAGSSAAQTALLTWSVSDTDRLPSVAAQANSEGQSISLNLAATDHSGTNSLTYSVSGLPPGLTINPSTGLLGGIIGYNAASAGLTATYSPTLTLTDNHGGTDTRAWSWSVSDTDRLPTVANQSSIEGHIVSLNLAATDFTGTNSLTYSASGLPAGLTINPTSGLLSGAIASTAASLGLTSVYAPTVTLTDNHGGAPIRGRGRGR